MKQFITRVELHGTRHDEQPYLILHDAMAANGFKREIAAEDGVIYHLLTAEYLIVGNYTTETVIESAIQAAELTDKKYSIFVAEYIVATFVNLVPVKR